jgi:hypothetical protein
VSNISTDTSNVLIDVSNEIQYVDGMIITDDLIAINATGGFSVDISLVDIKMIAQNPLRIFDLTETLQIDFDVRIFNEKLGVLKNATNTTIVDTSFNSTTGAFPNDSINITFEEFKNNVSVGQVFSVGKFETLYSDFKQYINRYFYYSNLFPSLIKSSEATDISNGLFEGSHFIELINGQSINENGETVNNFSGNVLLNNVNQALGYIVRGDPFQNRSETTDLSYSVADGFIAGDLILVNPGIDITLQLVIDTQSFITDPCFNLFTLSTTTEAPILFRLDNLS